MRKENQTTNRMRKSKITSGISYKQKIKQKEKGQNAITLIALVVTIIVLLILAGIAISMLTGDNSILNKTAVAKMKNDETQIEERIRLAYHSALAGGQGSYTKKNLEDELKIG